MRRRTFLSLGIAGAAAFAAAGWWTSTRQRGAGSPSAGAERRRIVAAIVPAMLAGALPEPAGERAAAVDETVRGVDQAIAGLPPAARAELAQLFELLAIPAVRYGFAGLDKPWESATTEEVAEFLDRWRDSRWALKRSAYDALHQLIIAAWYGNPRSWTAIGYPGPPPLAS
jgi:hypothetical protein